MNKPLNVVVITDDHYVILLAALIKSIEEHVLNASKIVFHIIEDRVSFENKQKLHRSVNENTTSLEWVKMDGLIPAGTQMPIDKTTYPLNIYMRFFIPYFMDSAIETVLYLDVDMIVQADISPLFNLDLSSNIVAAVMDPRIKTFDNAWGGIRNYKELGFDGSTKYFNSGLLVMNLKKWKEEQITDKLIHCMNDNIQFANYPDQYGLNVILANQWVELDRKWNHFATMELEMHPYLIHFVERKPIYKSYSGRPEYREKFYFFLKKTEWKNFQLINESKRVVKKIKNILNKWVKRLTN